MIFPYCLEVFAFIFSISEYIAFNISIFVREYSSILQLPRHHFRDLLKPFLVFQQVSHLRANITTDFFCIFQSATSVVGPDGSGSTTGSPPSSTSPPGVT